MALPDNNQTLPVPRDNQVQVYTFLCHRYDKIIIFHTIIFIKWNIYYFHCQVQVKAHAPIEVVQHLLHEQVMTEKQKEDPKGKEDTSHEEACQPLISYGDISGPVEVQGVSQCKIKMIGMFVIT